MLWKKTNQEARKQKQVVSINLTSLETLGIGNKG